MGVIVYKIRPRRIGAGSKVFDSKDSIPLDSACMDMQELLKHFGTQRAIAKALGTSDQVVSAWNRNGIPPGRQYEIQILTGGQLRASPDRHVSHPTNP